jgi:imidazole glycerol-phosphate synthase subunit HisF
MLYSRIIPCLLVKNKGLVKTIKFKDPKYVGDPINAVKIFNEKEVDEIIILDIDATGENREPDYKMIENLANECRMPLCYGGGIKTVDQAQRVLSLGVEKIALSSIAFENSDLIQKIASQVGNQSVVVIIDAKKKWLTNNYEAFTHNGERKTKLEVVKMAKFFESMGAGEIVINSIDQDGLMQGYDLDLVEQIRKNITIPLTVLGGAGSYNHIHELVSRYGVIGASAGSLFVFKGKYRAVLINYPEKAEKDKMMLNQGKIR